MNLICPPLLVYNDITMPTGFHSDQVINVDELRRNLPALPSERREKLQDAYGLSVDNINTIMVGFYPSQSCSVDGCDECNVEVISIFYDN